MSDAVFLLENLMEPGRWKGERSYPRRYCAWGCPHRLASCVFVFNERMKQLPGQVTRGSKTDYAWSQVYSVFCIELFQWSGDHCTFNTMTCDQSLYFCQLSRQTMAQMSQISDSWLFRSNSV
jgi:hypothetical protein